MSRRSLENLLERYLLMLGVEVPRGAGDEVRRVVLAGGAVADPQVLPAATAFARRAALLYTCVAMLCGLGLLLDAVDIIRHGPSLQQLWLAGAPWVTYRLAVAARNARRFLHPTLLQ